MKKTFYIFTLILLIFSSSCTEEFDLIKAAGNGSYCIDAFLTSKKHYNYIKISKIKGEINTDKIYHGVNALYEEIAVEDAKVYLKYDSKSIEFKITPPFHNEKNVGYGNYETEEEYEILPGKTYTLEVQVGGKTFISTNTVIKGPETMTGKIERVDNLELQKDQAYVSYVNFDDPNTNKVNYYITLMEQGDAITENYYAATSRHWPYNILSDQYLKDEVRNLKFPFGTSSTGNSWYPSWNNDQRLTLFSVDKMTYEYYQVLIEQIKNKGGAFSQSPSSAITNFKGGAVGYFIAADVTQVVLNRLEDNENDVIR